MKRTCYAVEPNGASPPALDGNLDDWKSAPAVVSSVEMPLTKQKCADRGYTMRCLYDAEGLLRLVACAEYLIDVGVCVAAVAAHRNGSEQ